jgi:hypothetical protein
LEFRPAAVAILQERWSDISPEEETEECVCSWCGKMIGRDEADPVWADHIEHCVGCEVCEIAVRLWRPGPQTLELRFHVKCFNRVIVTGNGT